MTNTICAGNGQPTPRKAATLASCAEVGDSDEIFNNKPRLKTRRFCLSYGKSFTWEKRCTECPNLIIFQEKLEPTKQIDILFKEG